MTREELIEMAALDVAGLLDSYEEALLNRSFHHAPASVQDEILELQAKLAADDSLLPRVQPDPGLRQRVLDHVARGIESESMELAPLATIGPTRAQVVADQPARARLGFSGQVWRAASFALVGLVVVLLFMLNEAIDHGNTISEMALENVTDAEIGKIIGPTFEEFANHPNATRIVLRPRTDEAGQATIYIMEANDGTASVFLLGMGLPESDEPYTLAAVGSDVQPIRTFKSNGVLVGLRVDSLAIAVATTASWRITDSLGNVLLET